MKLSNLPQILIFIVLAGNAQLSLALVDDVPIVTSPTKLERDRKIAVLSKTLTDMGKKDIADKLQKDYASFLGKVALTDKDDPTNPGTIASTNAFGITLKEDRLGLQHLEFPPASPKYGQVINKGKGISGALTIIHEYDHYDQAHIYSAPNQTPEWENSAWAKTITAAQEFANKIKSDIDNIDNLNLDPAAKKARLEELQGYSIELGEAMGPLRDGLKQEIAAGHVSADGLYGGMTEDALLNILTDAGATNKYSKTAINTALTSTPKEKDAPAGEKDKPVTTPTEEKDKPVVTAPAGCTEAANDPDVLEIVRIAKSMQAEAKGVQGVMTQNHNTGNILKDSNLQGQDAQLGLAKAENIMQLAKRVQQLNNRIQAKYTKECLQRIASDSLSKPSKDSKNSQIQPSNAQGTGTVKNKDGGKTVLSSEKDSNGKDVKVWTTYDKNDKVIEKHNE